MSTTAMWLLLAVVVIVIVFASVLYKRTFTVHELALTGVMAALSLVAYLFFRVPFYGGSSFHLGNTFTALTALLLDGVSGGLAGAIGLALADILAGDPGYAVTTFVLKFIIGITCGAVAHKVFKLRELDKHAPGYLAKVIAAAASGLLLNVFTDPFLGYFRNVYIFGQEYTIAKALTKITGGVTFVNSVASTVCVVLLYLALRPASSVQTCCRRLKRRPTSNQLPSLSDVLIKRKRHLPHGRCLFRLFLFKYEEPERDVRGQFLQCRETGCAVPGRFPVVGRHGEESFQLPGRHRDAAGDFPLSDGFKARIRHFLHRVFVRLFVEDGLHLEEMLCTRHGVDEPSAGAQDAEKLLLREGREAVEQHIRPACAHRLMELDATAYRAEGRAFAARRTAGFAMSKPASSSGRPASSNCFAMHRSYQPSPQPASSRRSGFPAFG